MTLFPPRLTDSDPWAAGLLAYYFVRAGDAEAALERLDFLAKGAGFDEQALHLWVSSELAAVSDVGVQRLKAQRERFEAVVERLGREFEALAPNWIDIGVPGTYLTRLALTFGAVSSYRNLTNFTEAAALLPRIKEVFFRDFLSGGRLKSRRGGESLYSDVVLASVPFGLMDAGNQIMVETVAALEARQFHGGFAFSADNALFGGAPRSDLDALLAWYFSERGDAARAQQLLAPWARLAESSDGLLPWAEAQNALDPAHWERTKPASATSARATVLFHLAQQNLFRLQGTANSTTVILHEPAGHGSRYHSQDRNRRPYQAVGGEVVTIRAVVRPFGVDTRASLVVEGAEGSGPLVHQGADGAEGWFEGQIRGLVTGHEVRYRIEAESAAGNAHTPWYAFTPGRREAVVGAVPRTGGRVAFTTASGAHFETLFEASSSSGAEIAWRADGSFELRSGKNLLVQSWTGMGLAPLSVDLDAQGQARRLVLRLRVQEAEEFYGAGERFSSLAYRGKRLDCWVFNQYRDQGLKTYVPLPFWQSSAGWGLRVLSDGYSATGFCDQLDGLVEVEAELEEEIGGFRFYAGRPWAQVAAFQSEVGPVALPPRWAFGPWMSSNNWDSQALTLEQARLTRDLALPATVLVLEQWSDEATFYVFNDAVYERKPGEQSFQLRDFRFPPGGRWPDPQALVRQLHQQGLKVLLWQAPVMKYMDGLPHAQRDADEATMIEKGWALQTTDAKPYRIPEFEWFKRSLVPDFSQAEAAAWWLEKRRYLFDDIGIDGIKTDGGEGVYGEVVDSQGHRGDVLRNRYPTDYIGAFHRFVQERTNGKGLTFSRAGFVGAWTMPAHWAGDERSTFEAFRNTLRAGLSAGLSGLPFWGWDLGGFHGEIPTAELYLRGVAMAAFCPIMQYHAESKGEKNRDRTPWNIAERTGDPRVIPVYRKFAQARMNLLPYLWDEARHSAATGEALMRALWAEYPEEPSLRHVDDQYFLGRHLLVAPIVHEGATERLVVFPPGRWVGLFDGHEVEGPCVHTVAAALDELPVWFRAGAAVALNLPASAAFPGDVGNQCDAYTQLAFRAAPGVRLDTVYRTYDGAEVRLQGTPGVDLLVEAPGLGQVVIL